MKKDLERERQEGGVTGVKLSSLNFFHNKEHLTESMRKYVNVILCQCGFLVSTSAVRTVNACAVMFEHVQTQRFDILAGGAALWSHVLFLHRFI